MGKKLKKIHQIDENPNNLVISQVNQALERVQEEARHVYEMAARSILKALDLKDNYTYGHSLRVAQYCLILAHHLGMEKDDLYELELSALFHDIGKIGIPDNILSKPDRLNAEEFEIMKTHPELSYEILKDFKGFEKISLNARHHHERYDGQGYPHGLKAEQIPTFSRIILIADTYDAITSSRVYRKGLSNQVAFDELEEFAGTQFDPFLVKQFIKAMGQHISKDQDKTYITLITDLEKLKAA
ncbi:MAG: HD-GYP domain-containing protein [Halobacteriovoraceae bacterium]|nr:HD-GYP domain-containing protein [Halobacteriovoraceae bacterium]